MKLRNLIFGLAMSLCSITHAGKFCLVNQECPSTVSHRVKDRDVQMRNLRMRIVAKTLFGKSKKTVHAFLNANHTIVDRAILPSRLSESFHMDIFNLTAPTNRFTMIVSADAFNSEGIFIGKFNIFAQDFLTDHMVGVDETLKLDIKAPTWIDGRVQMNFTATVGKHDGMNFRPLTLVKSNYSAL